MNRKNMGSSSTKGQRIHNAYIETSEVSQQKSCHNFLESTTGAVMRQCIGQGVHLLHWQVFKLQDLALLRLMAKATKGAHTKCVSKRR